MEEKDLAFEKKIKAQFEENVLNLIHKYEEGNMSSFEIGNVQVDIKTADKGYTISFGGYNLCSIDENKNITYNISELEGFKKKAEELMESGMPDLVEELGLPDIEYLKYLEKEKEEKAAQEREKGKEEGAEEEKDKSREEDDDEDKDKDKEDDEEKPTYKKRGLQELNLGVLVLINPKLRECSKAYLDPNTNSLVFKDKFGKEHGPEEYGFKELQTATGNFELTKMHENGEVTAHENPTKVYAIQGSNYGISTDFGTHHREVNVIVRDIEEGHENSYSIVGGNLAKFDSGDISKYQGQERIGTREGWAAGYRDDANEEAMELLEQLNSDDRNKFQEGFSNEVDDNRRINDTDDLKRVVAKILEEEYNESPEDAMEIATEIVDEDRNYYDIKAEREAAKDDKKFEREPGGFGPWDRDQDPRRG